MGVSPFFATCGYDPLISVYPDVKVTNLHAKHFAMNFDEVHKFLRDRMKDAQDTMQKYANQDCIILLPYQIGDHMFIHSDHIHMNCTACKLTEKKIGPFPIISQPLPMSFTLRLPSTICIHLVFHVSQLEPKHPNMFEDCDQLLPPMLIIDGSPEYLIEHIIDLKYNCVCRKCQLLYHVKWTGYPITNNASDWI